ncbi:ATP synthase subunit I [Marinobacterium mangrovicola]|nr:ATP synthase subunit I [Marinobacterium mangrovicola]
MQRSEPSEQPEIQPAIRSGRLQKRSRQAFLKVYLIQTGVLAVVAAACLVKGPVEAYSALLGGMLYLLPNLYFTWRVLFSKRPAETAQQVVISLYSSEIGKMVLAAGLFSATFVLVKPLSPFPLFLTFILLQLSGWMLQWRLNNRFLKL